MNKLSKIKGSLFGGAIGDALGYSVEFCREKEIFATYGKRGIESFAKIPAVVSDDTQMTLFTANALAVQKKRMKDAGRIDTSDFENLVDMISYSYRAWYKTQNSYYRGFVDSGEFWIYKDKRLHARRAPGNTCLTAINNFDCDGVGRIAHKINDSKGCGGVMRVAPIGLAFNLSDEKSIDNMIRLGAEAAALTHTHPLGYLPAAMLTHIVYILANDTGTDEEKTSIKEAVEISICKLKELFGRSKEVIYQTDLVEKAINLAESDTPELEAIHFLGEGWVGEEALAIAVYAAVKYPDDFEKAIVLAVNHNGDSDSTGAVCGNIIGAFLGIERIPEKYKKDVEMSDILDKISVELFS